MPPEKPAQFTQEESREGVFGPARHSSARPATTFSGPGWPFRRHEMPPEKSAFQKAVESREAVFGAQPPCNNRKGARA